jgi:hypothetical protein
MNRKSQSAFHCVGGSIEGDDKKDNDILINERKENSLIITVLSSFKSCDSKTKTRSRPNFKNFSLLNNRKSRLLT